MSDANLKIITASEIAKDLEEHPELADSRFVFFLVHKKTQTDLDSAKGKLTAAIRGLKDLKTFGYRSQFEMIDELIKELEGL